VDSQSQRFGCKHSKTADIFDPACKPLMAARECANAVSLLALGL